MMLIKANGKWRVRAHSTRQAFADYAAQWVLCLGSAARAVMAAPDEVTKENLAGFLG